MSQSIGPIKVNPPADVLWQSNGVASGTIRNYATGVHTGTLSIKTMLAGMGVWKTPDGTYEVDSSNYLVLNNGQKYTLEVSCREPLRTLAIFFRPGFVESLSQSVNHTGNDLDPAPLRALEFPERLEPKCDLMSQATLHFFRAFKNGGSEPGEVEDRFFAIAEVLLHTQALHHLEQQSIALQSPIARDEIYRRLNAARDFMLSCYSSSISLEDMAREACLSPSHFHYLFKSIWGMTPHQFLTRERIRRASILLKHTDDPIWLVCGKVGFESLSSFCKLYRRTTGLNPSAFRQESEDSTTS